MAGGRVYGGSGSSSLGVLLQNQRPEPPLDSLFLSGSGSRSMMSFEDGTGSSGFLRPFGVMDESAMDDELDEYFIENQPGKKRRLSVDQVQFLEKSFELENKLEPERKVQLAKDLGLQPRQVAIWFQNRRARWKTKQMEKDYDVLQANFNSLKADFDSLLKETDKLKAEVLELSGELAKREKEKESSGVSEEGEEQPTEKPVAGSEEGEVSKVMAVEDIGSAKSDILDSDSPRVTDGVHSNPLLETGDSSYVLEAEQSDLSQDEEDNLSRSFLPPYIFPKLEDVDYSDPPETSCNFGFPVEDHAFWAWS